MKDKKHKLNTLLAITDHAAGQFRAMLEDYAKFFKDSQTAFKGERKTYQAKPDTMDDPTKRSNKLVVTTVDEKFEFFEETSKDYINSLFSQEATNASGSVKAPLMVDGKNWGEFSALELLRLKSVLDSGSLKGMYEKIPVRNDDEKWTETDNTELYANRKGIFQTELVSGVNKTTEKEDYILPDPNIDKNSSLKYTPSVSTRTKTIELGDSTHQRFSGEWSHRQRAELLRRRDVLLKAVIEALKVANEAEAIESKLTATRLFDYLHRGKND